MQRANLFAKLIMKFESSEQCHQSFAECCIVGNFFCDVRASDFLSFFRAKPRQQEVALAVARAAVEGQE